MATTTSTKTGIPTFDTAFEQVRIDYGTIESYFADGLRFTLADQQRLRDRYLE